MSYKLTLTVSEESLLRIMHHKGYDCGLWPRLNAYELNEATGQCVFTVSEHELWECHDQYADMLDGGNDPWGPFVALTLRPKLDALMEEAV